MDSQFKIDKELIQETIAGNIEAYDQLYVRYRDQVLSMMVTRCGGNEALAKDIVQDAFIKAFVGIKKYDSRYSFGQWIFAIARNLFIDHTRRRKSEQQEVDTNTPCDGPNPEQRVISKQNTSRIEQSLSKLPKNYRTIFTLRYIDDLTYEEIAERLEIPMGTVKTQIHRSRDRFLKELGVVNFD